MGKALIAATTVVLLAFLAYDFLAQKWQMEAADDASRSLTIMFVIWLASLIFGLAADD
jgi:hypothetical protein